MTHFRPISLTSLILSYTLFTIGNNAVTFITYELKNNPDRISMETAEKIKKLIHQPELINKMGKASREKFDNYYSQNKFKENFYKILYEVLYVGKNV